MDYIECPYCHSTEKNKVLVCGSCQGEVMQIDLHSKETKNPKIKKSRDTEDYCGDIEKLIICGHTVYQFEDQETLFQWCLDEVRRAKGEELRN